MKLAIVLGVAVLALTGAAAAQGIEGAIRDAVPKQAFGPDPVQPLGSHWTNPQLWDGYDDPERPVGRDLTPLPSGLQTRMTQQVADGLKVAVPQMRLACAVDRQSLCAGKTSNLSADRCLEYYRLKVSKPCRQAWDQLTKAAEGRL
ncbi:hypothetical protein [Phenylobacterium sp.]|jgi:hypothetical protein|uniref:hypothetical protein n=1 Tax=Phenylobacterium sp. TaxID=1871053 RepID=UPI002E3794D5|nr:hypothetical protein [Phenylobacterium sp.]HEX3364844.1 hypothetical protein [Phenylobacterium sp.]